MRREQRENRDAAGRRGEARRGVAGGEGYPVAGVVEQDPTAVKATALARLKGGGFPEVPARCCPERGSG